MWCIGNEMDGPWQVGHMSPDEYAAAVDRVAHAMKLAESGLELVACGSSSAHMSTFGSWERSVLTKAYDNLDFVSCHAYYYERGAKSLQDIWQVHKTCKRSSPPWRHVQTKPKMPTQAIMI